MLLTSPRVPTPPAFPIVSNNSNGNNDGAGTVSSSAHERRTVGESIHSERLFLSTSGEGTQRQFIVGRSETTRTKATWANSVTTHLQQLTLTEVLLLVLVILLQLPSLSSHHHRSHATMQSQGTGASLQAETGGGSGRLTSAFLKAATQQTSATSVAVIGTTVAPPHSAVSSTARWIEWPMQLCQWAGLTAAVAVRATSVWLHRVPNVAVGAAWDALATVMRYGSSVELCNEVWLTHAASCTSTASSCDRLSNSSASSLVDGDTDSDDSETSPFATPSSDSKSIDRDCAPLPQCPVPSTTLFWSVIMFTIVVVKLSLRLRRPHTDEVLVLGGIGLQLTTRDGLGRVLTRRFVEADAIRSVFIHEAYYRQSVVFYLGALIDDEKHVLLLLPTTFPRLAMLQMVLCGVRGALYQEVDEGMTMAELEKLNA